MNAFIGTFAVGDTLHAASLRPVTDAGEDWGTGMGTGWTCELNVYRAGTTSILVTVPGSWQTAAELAALFTLGSVGLLAPTSPATTADYDAFIKLTKASDVYEAGPEGDVRTPFKFTIRDTAP